MNRSTLRSLLILGLLSTLAGCGRSELVSGSGRLTYKGKPVPNTYVTFMPEEEGKRASHGLSDDDGKFVLSFSRSEMGVLRGRHAVSLKYRASAAEEAHRASTTEEIKDVIARYSDPKTTRLHYEVTTDGQQFDINLD
jgi:hypothetical protein